MAGKGARARRQVRRQERMLWIFGGSEHRALVAAEETIMRLRVRIATIERAAKAVPKLQGMIAELEKTLKGRHT